MTTPMFKERAAAWAALHPPPEPEVCPIGGRCSCPTCGVIVALLSARLVRLGLDPDWLDRLHVEGGDLEGAHPSLAVITVETPTGRRQVARLDTVQDALRPDILADVKRALECR